jgi:hypothetical protein
MSDPSSDNDAVMDEMKGKPTVVVPEVKPAVVVPEVNPAKEGDKPAKEGDKPAEEGVKKTAEEVKTAEEGEQPEQVAPVDVTGGRRTQKRSKQRKQQRLSQRKGGKKQQRLSQRKGGKKQQRSQRKQQKQQKQQGGEDKQQQQKQQQQQQGGEDKQQKQQKQQGGALEPGLYQAGAPGYNSTTQVHSVFGGIGEHTGSFGPTSGIIQPRSAEPVAPQKGGRKQRK